MWFAVDEEQRSLSPKPQIFVYSLIRRPSALREAEHRSPSCPGVALKWALDLPDSSTKQINIFEFVLRYHQPFEQPEGSSMTMEELCAIEPRLTRLLEEARAMTASRPMTRSISCCPTAATVPVASSPFVNLSNHASRITAIDMPLHIRAESQIGSHPVHRVRTGSPPVSSSCGNRRRAIPNRLNHCREWSPLQSI